MALVEAAAEGASTQAVAGTRYLLGTVLPELRLFDEYVKPVIVYVETKDRISPGVVRLGLRGVGLLFLIPIVASFVFLSAMNLMCLCVSSVAMFAFEVR
ncbi:hypothetical protein BGZ94_006310 [Podila epigama]|nr:hypothetical protein BGZ94_006310 [Podila epigama]